ncbi:unnamed protein product [Calypogeia fissa]
MDPAAKAATVSGLGSKHSSSMQFSMVSYVLSIFSMMCTSFCRLMVRALAVGPIPSHIAIIMDGNRRFADKSGMERSRGHLFGYNRLINTLENCMELGVKFVSVYAFSIDNFGRPKDEVDSLMGLMEEKLDHLVREDSLLNQYRVKVQVLGDLDLLSVNVRAAAERAMAATKEYESFVLNLCVSYTSTEEIVHSIQGVRDSVLMKTAPDRTEACALFAVNGQLYSNNVGLRRRAANGIKQEREVHIIREHPLESINSDAQENGNLSDYENWSRRKADAGLLLARGGTCGGLGMDCTCADLPSCSGRGNEESEVVDGKLNQAWALSDLITVKEIESHLYTAGCPPPDILIRTSGETRLSNFMLWQCCSYSRLAFCRVLWPDFSLRHLAWIILDYQRAFAALQKQRKLQEQMHYGIDDPS